MTDTAPEPDPQQQWREAAKLAAARALHTLQCVQHGTAPRRALQHQFTPQALDAFDISQRPAIERIERIRMHVLTSRLAHVAAVTRTQGGQADAVVMELQRDGTALSWQVTQLTTAADRRLVHYTDGDVSDRRTRHLPDDLTSKLEAARRARDQAADKVAAYDRQRRTPDSDLRATAQTMKQRWNAHLSEIDQEIIDLEEVRRARQVRQAVRDGDPIVSARIRQLEHHLGPVPTEQVARQSWRSAANALQDYADRWTDGTIGKTLDTLAADPDQEAARQGTRHAVDEHLRELEPRQRTPRSRSADHKRDNPARDEADRDLIDR